MSRPDYRAQESWKPSDQASSSRRTPPRDSRPRERRRDGSGSAEPGQITNFTTYSERPLQHTCPGRSGLPQRPSYRDDRRRSPPRSPRQRSKSPYSRRSASPARKASHDKSVKGKGKESSFDAMDQFTQSMHATLLCTTAHILAGHQLSRLTSFSNLDPTHPAIVEARKNLVVAEEALWTNQVQVQQAFAELMRQTGGNAGVVDVDEIRARLARLESQRPPLPRDAPPLPPDAPPPLPEPEEPEITRLTVKDAIKKILQRLASVESAKMDMEEKYEDLEGLIWSQAEDRVQRATWEELERERRGAREVQVVSPIAGPSNTTPQPTESTPLDPTTSETLKPSESTVDRPITLSESPEPEITSSKGKEVDRTPPIDLTIAAHIKKLENDLAQLAKVIQRMQSENAERERAIVAATTQAMREEYTDVVKREVQKVAQSYEKRHQVNGTGSTSNGSANPSPSIIQTTLQPPQNALQGTPHQHFGYSPVAPQNTVNPLPQRSPQHTYQQLPRRISEQADRDMAMQQRGMIQPAAQTNYPMVNPYGQNGQTLQPNPGLQVSQGSAGASNSTTYAQPFAPSVIVPIGDYGQLARVTQVGADSFAVVVDGVTRIVSAKDLQRQTG